MPSEITGSETQGTKFALLQQWIRQACTNAGIGNAGNIPDISPGMSEGTKWSILGSWVKLLAENIGSSSEPTPVVTLSDGTGVTIRQTGDEVIVYCDYAAKRDITIAGITKGKIGVMNSQVGTLSLPDLTDSWTVINQGSGSNFAYAADASGSIDNINAPKLEAAGLLNLTIAQTYAFPKLKYIAQLTYSSNTAVVIDMPELLCIGRLGTWSVIPNVWNMPKLRSINTVTLGTGVPNMTSTYLPALEALGALTLGGTATLRVELPLLKYLHSVSGSAANMTDLQLGNGTLLRVGTTTLTFTNMKLNQTSVDRVLVELARLDGTNGTTLWGAGCTISMNGGTSATPSATGLAAKAVLQARGVTVNHN